MTTFKKTLYTICCLLLAGWASAQGMPGNDSQEPVTGMRADGKIYVVIAVVVTILTGLILYVFSLDRKISKLEKQNSKQ